MSLDNHMQQFNQPSQNQEVLIDGNYVQCEAFRAYDLLSAMSTKKLGNMSLSRDLEGNVDNNFNGFMDQLGIDLTEKSVCILSASHSTNIALLEDQGNKGRQTITPKSPEIRELKRLDGIKVPLYYLKGRNRGVDAVVTQSKNIIIGVLPADCAITHMYDPITHTLAVVHSGAIGAFSGIIPKTIQSMADWFSVVPGNLVVYIGPSVSKERYKLGDSGMWTHVFKGNIDAKWAEEFDQKDFVRDQLSKVGVEDKNIFSSEFCTLENDMFFSSARGKTVEEKQKEGRNLSIFGFQ